MFILTRKESQTAFRVIPLILVSAWAMIFIMKCPFKDSKQPISKPIIQEEVFNPSTIYVKARKINSSGVFYDKREINLSETVAYYDMWRSHWCTYYNDREFFMTPRINEILQMLRQFQVPVVTISMSVDAFQPDAIQRIKAKEVIARGALPILESYNAQQERYHPEYIPGFKDTCVYKDQERFGKYRDNKLTRAVAVTDEDYFVQNFKESAESFVGLGKKTVIVFGQHTNMCLMAVFLYCQQVGLDLIIVRDLVDGCWLYEYQHNHVKNHTAGNDAVNRYFDEKYGCSLISYDLINSLRRCKAKRIQPKYTSFMNHAYMFKYLFKK